MIFHFTNTIIFKNNAKFKGKKVNNEKNINYFNV